jgi:transcriptional regulator GlxA family with amidase domain
LRQDIVLIYPIIMPNWKKSSSGTIQVGVLLFDQFSNHCLANAVEPLRAANTLSRQVLFEWVFLSLDGKPVFSSSGLEIGPKERLDAQSGDMLFVMPSYAFLGHAVPTTNSALRAAARRYKTIAGFDTGSWLMAAAGLLAGRRATIHWEELAAFAEQFQDIEVLRERFVIDGDRITCTGAMAAFDLVMELVADRGGEALRQEVASLFMSDDRAQGFSVRRAKDRLVAQSLAMMQENLEAPIPILEMARKLGVSQKILEVRVKGVLGATPRQVYRRQRMILARKLVSETSLSVTEIAVRCGYQDTTAFTRAFQVEFGTSPRALRA